MKTNVFCLMMILALGFSNFARGAVIPLGESFLSPDKSKLVKILTSDGGYHYAITNRKNGKVSIVEDLYNPVLAIAWSSDSKSIFVIEHIAKGNILEIISLKDDHWKKDSIGDPESRFHDATILNWSIKPNTITIVSKIILEEDNGRPYGCYIATYDVNLSNGETVNLRKKNLNLKSCLELKGKFDPDYE